MACLRKPEENNYIHVEDGEKVYVDVKSRNGEIHTQKAVWYNSLGWILLMGDTAIGRTPFYFEEIVNWKPCT